VQAALATLAVAVAVAIHTLTSTIVSRSGRALSSLSVVVRHVAEQEFGAVVVVFQRVDGLVEQFRVFFETGHGHILDVGLEVAFLQEALAAHERGEDAARETKRVAQHDERAAREHRH